MKPFELLWKRPVVSLFVLFYALHLFGILGFVSFFEWGSGRPLLTDDYAFRSSSLYDARILFKTSRTLWGYSPYHLAGYPYYPFAISSSKGEQVLSLLFPFADAAELLKLYILIGLLTFPFWIMAATKALKLRSSSIAIAGILGMLFFWKIPNISSVRWGSISYILACPPALLALVTLLHFLEARTLRSFFLFCLWGAFALLIHTVTFSILFPPAVMLLLCALKRKPRGIPLLGGLGLFVTVAANLFWILPYFHYRSFLHTALSGAFLEKPPTLSAWYLHQDASRILLLMLGLWGTGRWFRRKFNAAVPFAVGIALLFSFMFFLKGPTALLLQRHRYDWPLSLFLSVPASALIAEKGSQFFDLLRRQGKKVISLDLQKASLLLFYGIILLGLLQSIATDKNRYTFCVKRLFLKEKNFASSSPLTTSMRPLELDRLLAWVQKNRGQEGRLLMEDSDHPHHVYWGTHLPAIVPLLTGREVITPPTPEVPSQLLLMGFTDGRLLGKPIEQLSSAAFREYVDRYNIRWVICFSQMAKKYLRHLSPSYLKEEALIGPFACYQIHHTGSFFLKGSGRVSADFNRISLKEVEAEAGEVILKYHWSPGIRTYPERKIGKEDLEGDDLGFIRIENPPEEIEIIFNPAGLY
ncbi:MAG: hypothetical protein HY590_00960 [Candidatus Omnitrophica bacterium]|nr:hypothetical protein [Candidatus Omnitrophota bacterium]